MSEIEGRKKEILDRLVGLIGQRNDAGAKVEIERLQKQLQNMSGDRDKRIGSTWENVQKELFTPEEIAERHSRAKIAPIETVYNGYRFRSRLEARWAVFFSEIRMRFEYEPNGYEISPGEWYLPDFYLPDLQVYVEIKPLADIDIRFDLSEKCKRFSLATGKAIYLSFGDPVDSVYGFFSGFMKDGEDVREFSSYARIVDLGRHDSPAVVLLTSRDASCIYVDEDGGINKKCICPSMMPLYYPEKACELMRSVMDEWEFIGHSAFDKARKKARQARFEHGEKGA